MADETRVVEATVEETQQVEVGQENTPTVDELLAKIEEAEARASQAEANAEKYKSANDKLSREAAESKRQLRARQTAEEQEAEAKAEAQRLADEEKESMRKELNHIKAVSAYKNVESEKIVEDLIDAVSEADHNAIAQIIENEKKQAVKKAESEWLKSRPQANAGTGGEGAITKEKFDKMTIAEKSKLYRENKAEYDRLIAQ